MMGGLYPEIEPYQHGFLEVEGNQIYWESCGDPNGKPALVLHGGPGSGCTHWHRRLFNPARYRVVLFDQRNCGRSRPHASAPDTDLSSNTTANLIADIESLRVNLDVERWLLLGGSWGSALALAYAEHFPSQVSELILFGVTTGRREEFDWLFRGGLRLFFPDEWEALRSGAPNEELDLDIVESYHRLLNDSDSAVREQAALDWCLWESATPEWPPASGLSPRFRDPVFRMAYARIVTHYVRHDGWLGDGNLIRDLHKLVDIPAVLINGRFDFQAPISTAWGLHQGWPRSELVVVEDAGHAADNPSITEKLVWATDKIAD